MQVYKKNICRGVAKKFKFKKGVATVKMLRNTAIMGACSGVARGPLPP